MKSKILFFLLLLAASVAKAQSPTDSFFATVYHTRFFLPHPVAAGESLMELARRYAVSQELLAMENELPFPQQITPGTTLRIPFNPANLLLQPTAGTTPVFFRCEGRENLLLLAGSAGRTFKELRDLNPDLRQYCTPGNLVLIGHLQQNLSKPAEVIPVADAPRRDVLLKDTPLVKKVEPPKENEEERAFKDYVAGGAQLAEQTGPITFFPGGVKGMYYAFHASAGQGAVLRIRNPVNGKTVYAKVIGTVPVTKNYHRSIAGVSDNARRALGALGDARLWCEVAFIGY